MSDLVNAACVPCRGGMPPLTPAEVAAMMPEVPGWTARDSAGVLRLEREFTFPDFRAAMAFAVRVGDLAETEGHHPDLHVAWGRVRVETWTHKIRGLHRNDFVLAAKIDALGEGGSAGA